MREQRKHALAQDSTLLASTSATPGGLRHPAHPKAIIANNDPRLGFVEPPVMAAAPDGTLTVGDLQNCWKAYNV